MDSCTDSQLQQVKISEISGDITQKGYEKKRRRLLQPFLDTTESSGKDKGHDLLRLHFPACVEWTFVPE